MDETFAETIGNIIAKAGIRAEQLVVELTESVFLKNFDLLSQQVEKMHAMGIRIAIDDFGTGFSSLSRLGDLKVDILKLDKQFIDRFVTASSIGISSVYGPSSWKEGHSRRGGNRGAVSTAPKDGL